MKLESRRSILLRSYLETGIHWLQFGSLIVAGLCVAYLISGVVSGQLQTLKTPADIERARQLVSDATLLLMISSAIGSLITLAKVTEAANPTPAVVLAVGLVLWFGFPALIHSFLRGRGYQANPALALLSVRCVLAGQVLLVTLVLPLLRWAIREVRFKPSKKSSDEYVQSSGVARVTPAARPHVLSPCWKLPYCRDFLLAVCPAFKAKRRCWKIGRGCFCDTSMIENMIMGVQKNQRGYMRSEIDARTGISRQRSKKRPPCRRCFIYLEHQELKYRALSPLVYPGAITIIYFLWGPVIQNGWGHMQHFLWGIWERLSFAPTGAAQQIQDEFGQQVMAGMFGMLLGLVILLGLLRLVEVWCFKWKW